MKFSAREDIEAPAEYVFEQLSNFQNYERQALRRGADVRRLDSGDYGVGSSWDVSFAYRGRDRKLRATVEEKTTPVLVRVSSSSDGLDGETILEVVPLSPKRTRIAASIEIRPKTLSARLLIQSLKLAKSNLTNRFKKRISDYAEDIENRYQSNG